MDTHTITLSSDVVKEAIGLMSLNVQALFLLIGVIVGCSIAIAIAMGLFKNV